MTVVLGNLSADGLVGVVRASIVGVDVVHLLLPRRSGHRPSVATCCLSADLAERVRNEGR